MRVAMVSYILLVIIALPALAVMPAKGELSQAKRWAERAFARAPKVGLVAELPQPDTGLFIEYASFPIQCNERDGSKLRIADEVFEHGLYAHAHNRLVVKLSQPARRFTAAVGIDTNGQWGGGSVVFVVEAAGKEVYRSPLKLRKEPATRVDVDLGGAREFVIVVEDGGDNYNSDQADWAEATVTLEDGSTVRLGDLPLLAEAVPERSDSPVPFSFLYDGKSSDELLPAWRYSEHAERLDWARKQRTIEYLDPATGLLVKCIAVEYDDFPTVEWTVYLTNTGDEPTPLVSQLRGLDATFPVTKEPLLHHFVGSVCEPRDYQPLVTSLPDGASKRITTGGGRPTNSDMPYFNLETGTGGVIAAIGWPGQWAADFLRKGDSLRLAGGQETTRFSLQPGETARGPLVALQWYEGDWQRAQNIWRRWMLAHNTPHPHGKPLQPMASACNGNHYPGIITNATEELHFLQRYVEEDLKPDFWWQDAGWYQCEPEGWPRTGTWEVEPSRWPKGLREVSDWCHEQAIGVIVWFEPERVFEGTYLWDRHPDWILGYGGGQGLLNLGLPEVQRWLVTHMSRLMEQQGIDVYRQDFNIDPLGYWQSGDSTDRRGLTENLYCQGYLAWLDEFLARQGGALMDSCASGGRRNDLETLRRAVPLLRSDYTFEPVGEQCHTYGLSFWMPFNGTGFLTVDPYLIRSQMSPEFTLGLDTRRTDLDYDLMRKLYAEWKEVSGCYFGDYWPLSDYSLANNVWMAWQFDLPEEGRGFIQAFRRADCPDESFTLHLRGLDPDATYQLTDADSGEILTATGAALATGFEAKAPEAPAALLWTYRKVE